MKIHFCVLVSLCGMYSASMQASATTAAVRMTSALVRHAGMCLITAAQEKPHMVAGGVIGGYFGYKAAGDSKLHGFVGGACAGALLVSQRRRITELEALLETQQVVLANTERTITSRINNVQSCLKDISRRFEMLSRNFLPQHSVVDRMKHTADKQQSSKPLNIWQRVLNSSLLTLKPIVLK